VFETSPRHGRIQRTHVPQRLERGLRARRAQGRQHFRYLSSRSSLAQEEPQALEHDCAGRDAEADEQPEHPARARAQHEVEGLSIDGLFVVHGISLESSA
jgi:hypothetical protein